MKYVVHKRFKKKALCGQVNIPATTECNEENGCIYLLDGRAICYTDSMNACQHFARDDDGNGMLRGNLTQEIMRILTKRDKNYQARWDKIWDDKFCEKFKRPEYENRWFWNDDFYNASIEDLQYILKLIKG